jgi:O-antigen/teichoic acid export membrane protein
MAKGLERSVASGVAWSFSEKFLTMAIQMVVSIVVARELMPEDFGVMAIMTFFTSVALTIVDSGFSQALIRKSQPSDEDYSSVLSFNVVTSLVLYVALVTLAWPVAHFYELPVIIDIAPVLFLLLPVNALCVVQTAMLNRELRFKLLSQIIFSASLISGVIAVVMAFMGFGIWALVAQRLLMMAIKAILFWTLHRWRWRVRPSMVSLRSMAPFSLRLLATDLVASIYNNVAQLFIGKSYSTSALGYYSQAQKLKDLPVLSIVSAVQGVTFPALSRMGDDRERLVEGYMRIMRMLSFVIFPIMLGLVAVAPEMFMLLLGEKWMPTVPFFEILALAGLFYPLGVVSYNILKVLSDGRVILRLEVVKRVIMTLILIYTIPQGIESIAWGMSAMAVVEFVLNTLFAMRYMNMGMMPLLGALLPSLLLACAMFGGLHLVAPYLGDMHTSLRLLSMVAIGGVVYLCGAWLLRLTAFNECVAILKGLHSKSA